MQRLALSKRWRALVSSALALMLAVSGPLVALAVDDAFVDQDFASTGKQNIIPANAAPGGTVNTNAQLVIERGGGGQHLVTGTVVSFQVNTNTSATTLPTGYSVAPLNLTIPSTWGTVTKVSGNSAISFTAPSTPGNYSYDVKWNATPDRSQTPGAFNSGGATAKINLTVTAPAAPHPTNTVVTCELNPVTWNGTASTSNTNNSTCTATVTDASSGGTLAAPVGTVNFASDKAGTWSSSATCTLAATATPGEAKCSRDFTPGVVGQHTITGTFVPTNTNDFTGSSNTHALDVFYNFNGFFSPIDNGELNTVKAGSSVPIKFSLSGYQGTNIFAANSPASKQVACPGSLLEDAIEEIATPGSSGLSYDAATDRYNYVWKTDKAWAGQCRVLVVYLNDGSRHPALFKLLK